MAAVAAWAAAEIRARSDKPAAHFAADTWALAADTTVDDTWADAGPARASKAASRGADDVQEQ